MPSTPEPSPTPAKPPLWDDATALNQIAAILGLYATDPGDNPLPEVVADIVAYVKNTGRSTSTPEGA